MEVCNKKLDPEDKDAVKNFIAKMRTCYGKTVVEEATEAWKQFKDMKRNSEEKIDDIIVRFEISDSNLKCSNVQNLPKGSE